MNNLNRDSINQNNMINLEMLNKFKTETWLKMLIAFLFGFLPMLLIMWIFGTNDSVGPDGWWGTKEHIVTVDYGLFWVIGFAAIFVISALIFILIRFTKDVKVDVFPMLYGVIFTMFSIFVIPVGEWWLLLICPVFFFIGLVVGQIVLIIYVINKFKGDLTKMQTDLKEAFGDLTPNPDSKTTKEFESNPYVKLEDDVVETNDEDKNKDDDVVEVKNNKK